MLIRIRPVKLEDGRNIVKWHNAESEIPYTMEPFQDFL